MKIVDILFFAGLICVASAKLLPCSSAIGETSSDCAIRNQRSGINDHLRTFIYQERYNFPCGWPDVPPTGIPPLEPLFRALSEVAFDTLGSITNFRSTLQNTNIRGLQPFILDDIHMEIFGLWIRFDMRWNILNVDAHHSSSGVLNQQPFFGAGRADVVVRNFRIFGIVSLNTIPGNFLNMREIRFTIEAGDIQAQLAGLSPAVNAAINSALLPTLRLPETQAEINARVNQNVLPFANAILNTMTMPDLIFLLSQRASNPPPRRCFL